MAELTQELLLRVVHYDPETGVFTRRVDSATGINNVRWKAGQVMGGLVQGYRVVWVLGRQYKAHRLAFLYMLGRWPLEEVDHKNMIRDDNRWANLREASRQENRRNIRALASLTKPSPFKWVQWDSRARKWYCIITHNWKRFSSPMFKSQVTAAFWADKRARELHGEFARCNFPPLDGFTVVDRLPESYR